MQIIISQLEKIRTDYTPQLNHLNEEDFAHKPSPVKWSSKECLGHLIDSALNNARRFVVAQHEDKPLIVYEQEKWVSASGYQNYPLRDWIDLWVLINKHVVIILKNIPEEYREREVQTRKYIP